MKISEIASQIFLSEKLEDKILPTEVSEWDSSEVSAGLTLPGRAKPYRFSLEDRGGPLPSLKALESDRQKAMILHSFANHELLAIEIMAFCLLKFPHADQRFRKGLYHTICEEQSHFQMYCDRMAEWGFQFGDFPTNGFFWKIMREMKTPQDYVTWMSLTFEQANLDYCRYFIDLFAEIDDSKTKEVLEQVYKEEIGHVRLGAHWFEKWEGHKLSMDTYQKSLLWPLSPSWGKGKSFDRKGRREAGLPENFIDEMEVFHRTRGRAPSIFFFYPLAENHCIAPPKEEQSKIQKSMQNDLEFLPYFLAKTDDVLLVKKAPTPSHIKKLRSWGFPQVEILSGFDNHWRGEIPQSAKRKFSSLQPWGWDAHVEKSFEGLYFAESPPNAENFQLWYSKIEMLKLVREMGETRFTTSPSELGVAVSSVDQALDAWRKIPGESVIKGEYGFSGLAQRMLRPTDSEEYAKKYVTAILGKQQRAIVEPWYNKVFDYSIQITVNPDGSYRVEGLARFLTDAKGRYLGARLGRFDQCLEPEVKEFVNRYPCTQILEESISQVSRKLAERGYHGPAGIDCLVMRSAEGELRHRFGLEVNPRWNMGRLAVELQKRIRPGKVGAWMLVDKGGVERQQLWKDLEVNDPLRLKAHHFTGGFGILTDVSLTDRKLGVMKVAEDSVELGSFLSDIGLT